MSGSGDLGGYQHAGFLLDLLHPGKAFDADAFEAARLGAGFPDTGPEDLYAPGSQFGGGFEYLFTALRAARACDNHRTFGIHARKSEWFYFHFIVVVDFAIAGCNRRIRSVYILFTDSVLFGSS